MKQMYCWNIHYPIPQKRYFDFFSIQLSLDGFNQRLIMNRNAE